MDSINSLRRDRAQRKRQTREFAVDPRPRDGFGQFLGPAAGGADPNTMHAAYGNVVAEKARRADFIARMMRSRRRVFGLPAPEAPTAAGGAAAVASVPRIERASAFVRRKSGAGMLTKLEALTPEEQKRTHTQRFAARILNEFNI